MQVDFTLKHFVAFGVFNAPDMKENEEEEIVVEIQTREIGTFEIPKYAYYFYFFSQYVGSQTIYGKEVTFKSEEFNNSQFYYLGGSVYTIEEFKKEFFTLDTPDEILFASLGIEQHCEKIIRWPTDDSYVLQFEKNAILIPKDWSRFTFSLKLQNEYNKTINPKMVNLEQKNFVAFVSLGEKQPFGRFKEKVTVEEVQHRDFTKISPPENTICFYFFTQHTGFITIDGDRIPVSTPRRKKSPTYHCGGEAYTIEEYNEKFPNGVRIEKEGWEGVIVRENNYVRRFNPGDQII